MKYYNFVSKHYQKYFKSVYAKYHSDTFIGLISQNMLSNMQFLSSNVKPETLQDYSLSCMYLNARSLINKMPLLSQQVNEFKPKIIAVTETWAKPEIPDGMYNISGYKILRVDRPEKRGGGVMFYIHDSVSF